MTQKIYITGPVGSGKSTLARRLSEQYGFIYCELDGIVHKPDPSSPSGSVKRPEAERNALLDVVLSNERWIVEDTGRRCFEFIMQKADSIILLEPSGLVRRFRIVMRWLKQKLGIEKSRYIPDLKMLGFMFKWTRDYESGADGLKKRLEAYSGKISVLRNEKDILWYIRANVTV